MPVMQGSGGGALLRAFGGGASAPPSPYAVPPGVPVPQLRQAGAAPAGATPDILTALRSGALGAEQLLQLVMLLAGMGQGMGTTPSSEMLQAMTEGQQQPPQAEGPPAGGAMPSLDEILQAVRAGQGG